MADQRITDLAALTGSGAASGDLAIVVDVSDTSMAASGTDKKMTLTELATAITTLGSLATDAEVSSAISALSATYQPLDSDLTAIAALSTTSFGRGFLVLADAAAGRTALGLGTAATADTGTGASNVPTITQADARYQPLDSDLTAIAGLTSAADRLPYFTGSGTASLATFTSAGRALIDDADASAQRTTLGLGTAATANTGTGASDVPTIVTADARYQPLDSDLTAIAALSTTTFGRSLLALADSSAARTTLGVVIGTDVQAYNADLAAIAGITRNKGDLIVGNASAWVDLAVGTDTHVLTADSSTATGLKWAAAAAGGAVATDSIWDAKGDLAAGTGADTAAKLTVGTADQVLVPASAETTGLKWQNAKPFTPISAPTDITGCVVWLDASDANSFTYSSSTVVSQWSSRDSGAKAFTEATTTKQPNRNGSLNGLSTVVFDGTDDILTWTGTLTGGTAFAVFSITSTSASPSLGGINSKRLFAQNLDTNSSNDWPAEPSYANGVPAPALNGGVYAIINGRHNVRSARASSTSSLTNMTLGYQAYSPAYSNVSVAEVIIYDTVLTRRNMERVEQYLREKWDR